MAIKGLKKFSEMRVEAEREICLHMLDYWHFNVADDFDGVRLRPKRKIRDDSREA